MTTILRPTPTARIRDDSPPTSVVEAAVALALALVAGIVEALARAAEAGPTDLMTTLLTFMPRLLLYGVVAVVIRQLLHSRRWALWALLIGIGGIGTASLVVDPIIWLASGPDIRGVVAGWSALEWLAAAARTVHLAAVLIAVVLLLRPATWRFVRRERRPRQDSNLRHLL